MKNEETLKACLKEWNFKDVNINDKCYLASDLDTGERKNVNLKYIFNLLFLHNKNVVTVDSKASMYSTVRNLVGGLKIQLLRYRFEKKATPKPIIKPKKILSTTRTGRLLRYEEDLPPRIIVEAGALPPRRNARDIIAAELNALLAELPRAEVAPALVPVEEAFNAAIQQQEEIAAERERIEREAEELRRLFDDRH